MPRSGVSGSKEYPSPDLFVGNSMLFSKSTGTVDMRVNGSPPATNENPYVSSPLILVKVMNF